jgi:hypothetical protein
MGWGLGDAAHGVMIIRADPILDAACANRQVETYLGRKL